MTKYDKQDVLTTHEAAKLLNCQPNELSKYKLTKLTPRAPFKALGQKTYFYLKSEVLSLVICLSV